MKLNKLNDELAMLLLKCEKHFILEFDNQGQILFYTGLKLNDENEIVSMDGDEALVSNEDVSAKVDPFGL